MCFPNIKKKFLKRISLSESCKAIILGSILGDGSLKIYKPYKNARFWIRHSVIQKEYWEWKISQLSEIQTTKSKEIQKPSEIQTAQRREEKRKKIERKKKLFFFQSAAKEELTQLYNILYKKNRVKIRRTWLNSMTPLSLAIWWLDDGRIIGNGKRGVFCTDCFSKEENKLLKNYLFVVWKIEVSIGLVKRTYKGKTKEIYRLYLNTTSLKKFFRIIMPYTPRLSSMIYKYCILYKDTELQQRWISEMLHLMQPSMKNLIINTINERKQKLKHFRK